MIRFILLTFGFLGWAFYEMSGGADFEPLSVRLEAEARANHPATAPAEVADATIPAAKTPVTEVTQPVEQDVVTRVALNLTTLRDAQAKDGAATPEAPQTTTAKMVPARQITAGDVPVNAGATLSSADTPAIIPSLIVPQDTGAQAQTVSASSDAVGDMRSVSGNRVNVRGGPGTEFGVVTRLVQGDMVEVLEDTGDGWVRLRPLNGAPEGWMADFLLTDG